MHLFTQSHFSRILAAESLSDVRNIFWEEVHDASPMTLFLLSLYIHLVKTDIAQKKRLKLFLVTATEDSPICEAIGEFAKQQLGVEKGDDALC